MVLNLRKGRKFSNKKGKKEIPKIRLIGKKLFKKRCFKKKRISENMSLKKLESRDLWS